MHDLLANLSEQLAATVSESDIPGASLALFDGEQIHSAVAGVRNSMTGDLVTADTLLHIGSITKIFNATLVLQLVDDGLVDLDDRIIKHVPGLQLRDMAAAQEITVRMLLNHTSGIDGMLIPDHGPDLERIEDGFNRLAGLGQLHRPGAGPSYSNAAVLLSGYLVQKLRGISWYSAVKDRILTPLGMRHSLVDLTEIPLFRVSVGDLTDPASGQRRQTTRPFLPLSFAPAGATMMTSAEDLLQFAVAHLNLGIGTNGARILSEVSARLMQQPTVDVIEPASLKWGLGWQVMPGGLIGHGGGGPGVASQLFLHPETRRAAALLTNGEKGGVAAMKLLGPLLEEWSGQPWPPVAAPLDATAPPPVSFAPYVGLYGNALVNVEVFHRAGGLAIRHFAKGRHYDNVQTERGDPIPLVYVGNDSFDSEVPGFEMRLRFVAPGTDGRHTAIGFASQVLAREA